MYKVKQLKAVMPAQRFGGYFSRWTGASHLSKGTEFFQEEYTQVSGWLCTAPLKVETVTI